MEINSLPTEILFMIFNYLDFKSQMHSKNVCVLWYRLVLELVSQQRHVLIHDVKKARIPERCGNFNLFGLKPLGDIPMISLKDFKGYYPYRDIKPYITAIVPKFNNLRTIYLCLFNTWNYPVDILSLITDSCDSDLRHLSIIIPRSVTLHNQQIKQICKKYPNLNVFQFEVKNLKVCPKGITFLLKSLKKLQVFILMDTIHSYERNLFLYSIRDSISIKDINKSIRVIKVSGILMSRSVIEEMPELKQLNNLHICDFDGIQTAQLISQKFTNLLSLTLSVRYNVLRYLSEGQHLMESITNLSQLQKLHLFIETQNCIFTYYSFSNLKKCPNLTTIQIESTTLNSGCIEAITHFVPQLKKLDLTYIKFEGNHCNCISYIKDLGHLQSLKMSFPLDEEFDETVITNIMENCTQLKLIDFSRIEQVLSNSFQSIVEAAKSRPNKKLVLYLPTQHKTLIECLTKSERIETPNNLVIKYPSVRYVN